MSRMYYMHTKENSLYIKLTSADVIVDVFILKEIKSLHKTTKVLTCPLHTVFIY